MLVGTGYRPPELIQLGIERRTPPPLPLPAPLSTDEKLKALAGAFATMAGYGLTFVAILLLLLDAWVACSQYSVLSSWGRANAEVISGEVYSDFIRHDTSAQAQSRPVYGFRCTVRFQANGRLYESGADIGYEKSAKSEMTMGICAFLQAATLQSRTTLQIPTASNWSKTLRRPTPGL